MNSCPTEGDHSRMRYSDVAVTTHPAFLSDAPRKNHMWGIRRLAGPIRDVGFANRRESVSAGLRKYGVRKAWPFLLLGYLDDTAIA